MFYYCMAYGVQRTTGVEAGYGERLIHSDTLSAPLVAHEFWYLDSRAPIMCRVVLSETAENIGLLDARASALGKQANADPEGTAAAQ